MITQKDAVMAAFKHLSEVMVAANQQINEVRIEEVVPLEDGQFFSVVLSYDVVGQFSFQKTREYKEFKIDTNTSAVIYMKIRNVNA